MRQHYLIGRHLRKQYIEINHLLSLPYNDDELRVYNTVDARTVESVESQLIGLYYEDGQDVPENWHFQRSTDLPPLDIDPI